MNKNTRRNIIQFRLNDAELQAFDEVKKAIKANNNADAIRLMIADEGLEAINKLEDSYSNLQAQLEGLLWSVTNLTNNANQLAHAANQALQSDPADSEVWNWVIDSLQKLLSIANQLQSKVKSINLDDGSYGDS